MAARGEFSRPANARGRQHPSPPDLRPRFNSVSWDPRPPRPVSPSHEPPKRRVPSQSPARSRSRSVSRTRSISHTRSEHLHHHHSSHRRSRSPSPASTDDPLKPWFKKKTLWTTVATIASVAALVPAAVSARASHDAADASKQSARASTRSAQAVERSTHAVVTSTVAQGHMDNRGRYTGPREHCPGLVGQVLPIDEYDRGRRAGGVRKHGAGGRRGQRRIEPAMQQRRIEYGGGAGTGSGRRW